MAPRGGIPLTLVCALILGSAVGARGGGGGQGVREWDGQVVWDDDVAVLNGRSLGGAIRGNAHVLVQFYAPWCGHCERFEPVFRKAASHLRIEGVEVLLAKVDGPSNPDLMREHGVAGFPSLHWFAYGQERPYDGGRRNDSLIEWVTYHARPDAVTAVASTREADDYLRRIGAEEAVVGRFQSRHTAPARAFLTAAEEDTTRVGNKTIPYVMITEQRGIGVTMLPSRAGQEAPSQAVQGPAIGPALVLRRSAEAGGGAVVFNRWYRPPLWHLNSPDKRYVLFDPDRIAAFIGTYRMPTVVTLSPKTWTKVLRSPVRNQTILFSDEDTPGHEERLAAFEAAARGFFGRVLFLQIRSSLTGVMDYFGMYPEEFPAVVVAVAPSDELAKGEMFRLDQGIPENNLTRILEEEAAGGGACAGGGTCSAARGAVERMAHVMQRFALSAFEGRVEEFKLPQRGLDEEVTWPDDPVRKLTAETFDEVVHDPTHDVLVKFFAPWCGHCRAMKAAYMELHDRLEQLPNVTVAEYDASTHKVPQGLFVEGFPTILLFPALPDGGGDGGGGGKKVPIQFSGRREVEDMAAFVERHAVSVEARRGLERRIAGLEEEQRAAVAEERFEDAAKVRDQLKELRRELAGHAVAVPGGGEKKNRQPIYSKRILMEALRKQKEEEKARLAAA